MSKELLAANKVANQSTIKLVKAGETLSKLLEDFGRSFGKSIVAQTKAYEDITYRLEEKSQEYDVLIATKEAEILSIKTKQIESNKTIIDTHKASIEEITTDKTNRLRQAKIDFDLAMRENRDRTIREVLSKTGETIVPLDKLESLEEEVSELKSKASSDIKNAVGAAEGIAKARFDNEVKSIKLTNERDRSDDKATLKVKDSEIKFLTEQVAEYRSQIAADRKARVDEASAKSQVFNLGGKG